MNGGKDIKLGDDRRIVSIVPSNEQFLYNIANGEQLTDEFGDPLVTEVDTFFTPDASKKRSTPIVFTNDAGEKIIYETITTYSFSAIVYEDKNYIELPPEVTNIPVGDLVTSSDNYFPVGTIVTRYTSGRIYISNYPTKSSVGTITLYIKRIVGTKTIPDIVWKIEEQFKESSEVSSTLLGIERSETQLSLFSNVSAYGLDKDDFESFSYNESEYSFSWQNRLNEIYGNRYLAKNKEEVQESAIRLEAFPVPYTFPFGPNFEKVGLYQQNIFNQYLNFVQMGNDLDSYFESSGYPDSWKRKFLPVGITSVFGGDVVYSAGISTSFDRIDTWTDTWRDIRDSNLRDPLTLEVFNFTKVAEILGNNNFTSDNTRPGYSDSSQRYSLLQSRRVFRYQPGRISGFTFGVRTSVEVQPGSSTEWGISNPTDQYLFKVENGQFSIVRRSTIPLERSALERSNLTLEDQVRKGDGSPFNETEYWTIEIPRDKFNGDPLNSNGPSGYLLQPEKVTMYKIEFGWYGAIGARFYAYIPTDNGDARWVTIHTLVIENSLGSPCLQDSYFRFVYILNINNTRDLRTPQFIYKYGASYYIDGGDEGTSQIYSVSSKQKEITGISSASLIGIKPKDFIVNSSGEEITNKKLIIPTRLNVSTDSLTEVSVLSCTACPGFGYAYTPGVATTEYGKYIDQVGFSTSNVMESVGITSFSIDDIGSKIIAPSIYNSYILGFRDEPDENGNYFEAEIGGFTERYGFELATRNIGGELVFDRKTGIVTTVPLGAGTTYPHPVRLSKYDAYFASDFELRGSTIEIQFVNPDIRDEYAHWSDFLIGVTNKTPDIQSPNILNGFVDPVGGGITTIIENSEILYQEHTHAWAGMDENAVEVAESWGISSTRNPPRRMGIDYRIPKLTAPAEGICSKLTINILNPIEIQNVVEYNYEPILEGTPDLSVDPEGKIWLQIEGNFPNIDYSGGQIAILDNDTIIQTNVRFVGIVSSYTGIGGTGFSYIRIDDLINIDSGTTTPTKSSSYSIFIRPVTATSSFIDNQTTSKSKLFNYNPFPLYLVGKLRDYAQINNITVKETIGDFQRTISPQLYVNEKAQITNANGNASLTGEAPENFQEVSRSSSALLDTQNQQILRPSIKKDTLYFGADTTNEVDLKKIFGVDRNIITPDNNNIEATFITAKKIDGPGTGNIEISINYKEQ